ncbi:thyroid adenoma-associated -like protein [Labeo rohita]|uniref:Thyroid adenoma-associated-like protein n=1 Tax=Labeo rohita TaxID=84645 RepID=A0A498NHL7_LABRO|nr:thyroid adenoma-associated -like protein [Labeo rohita]
MTIINFSSGQADAVLKSVVSEDQISSDVKDALKIFLQKLTENVRSAGKRSRERSLEEASQILQKIPKEALRSLQPAALHQFVQLVLALQLEAVTTSSACRKLDQMLQVLAEINSSIAFEEVKQYLQSLLHQKQVFSLKDLQIACMFLEDSAMGREVLKADCSTLLSKVTELIPVVMSDEPTRNGPLCYQTVKICLQVFQLLPGQVAPMVYSKDSLNTSLRDILEFLMSVILGETCLLLNGLFPFISALCEEKLDCHYYVFQVFTIWLKRLKECLSEVWEVTGASLDSDIQQHLTQIIWSNAESPVNLLWIMKPNILYFKLDGVAEVARSAFCLFMEIYDKDCLHFDNTEKRLYVELLNRISELPWESKAKYLPLTAILPYAGTDKVLELYPALPSHILKCLSSNHLSPCASEVYRSLLQEQKQEFIVNASQEAPPTEQDLANQWAQRWQPVILEALTSELTLLQNNASSHLLPSTLRTFPGAFNTLLSALDPTVPGHLHAWACVMSAQRATSGHSLWSADSPHALKTLHLALSSLDESVRLAALNLLCCSPKTKELPSQVEYSALRDFIPLNLNSESSPFRQHLQAALRKFLVRIRDSCMASIKGHNSKKGLTGEEEAELTQGVEFVDWLSQLSLVYLTPGSSYQRKKTVLLLLSAVLETCTDTWSPDRKKGQPPAVLLSRAERLLHSPRVQEAQMGALMIKLLLHKVDGAFEQGEKQSVKLISFLLTKLEHHYLTARNDMLLAAHTTPIHGIVSALQRGLLEVPGTLVESITHSVAGDIVSLIEKLTLLLLGVLYGDQETEKKDVPPSFCDMGNAISSLIGQGGVEGAGLDEDGDENVLLSEEHSLVLTCCWVSLKEIGIFLGSLVERILSLHCKELTLSVKELRRASKVFKDIILKCRHWGAVEGCCIGFTKFCRALLSSSDPEIREIPPLILQQGLSVLQSPRSTSVTRRAAGLPMLILGVLAAEDSIKSRPLLAQTINTLLDTAKAPLPQDWDQTLDLPQVCAVHTLQALVKGSSLGVAVLQYTPVVAVLSLTLLSSPCWAMRNAALQLYSSLCTRMLGQQPAGEEGSTHSGMSSPSFFNLYPALQPFLQGALESAAKDLHDATLLLHPSLYPVLTLLAKLQPGAEEQTRSRSSLSEIVSEFESRLWMASVRQRCPLVRLAYVDIVRLIRGHCSQAFLSQLSSQLLQEIHRTPNILEVGSASFHQSAVNFLCGDPEWACQVWQRLANGNAVVRLSLVKSATEGRGWRGTVLQQVMEKALQANLKKALLDQNVEYRGAFLTALVEAMTPDEESLALPCPCPSGFEETWLLECVEVLFTDLESDRGGPELISTALCAVSLLLCHSVDLSLLQRWCKLLEKQRCPEAPEALRTACAQALCLCGVHVVTRSLKGGLMFKEISTSLISTGIYLLQDETPQVRAKAAVFASLLCCSVRRPEDPQKCFHMQVNQALHSLLDLLLEEFWDASNALEALVCHLPDCDLNAVLKEAKETHLYERDEANVFAEPSVISECLLPHLLNLVKHYPESSILAKNLEHWARNSAAIVKENVTICTQLQLDVGDHNFCRNPDGSEKPWCYVSGSSGAIRKEACDIRPCQDQNSTEAMAPEESVTPRMVETFENSDSFPSQVEGAAVQPVKAVRQQVRSGPKKKKDLGTLGYVLAVFMMAIIILLGGGITMGYFYKRGRDLKKQHEQRVYEREMHRITLPLSAFANPTCELVDENTIVITAEPNNQTPTQEPVEGADPLMGTAGTPGA